MQRIKNQRDGILHQGTEKLKLYNKHWEQKIGIKVWENKMLKLNSSSQKITILFWVPSGLWSN